MAGLNQGRRARRQRRSEVEDNAHQLMMRPRMRARAPQGGGKEAPKKQAEYIVNSLDVR